MSKPLTLGRFSLGGAGPSIRAVAIAFAADATGTLATIAAEDRPSGDTNVAMSDGTVLAIAAATGAVTSADLSAFDDLLLVQAARSVTGEYAAADGRKRRLRATVAGAGVLILTLGATAIARAIGETYAADETITFAPDTPYTVVEPLEVIGGLVGEKGLRAPGAGGEVMEVLLQGGGMVWAGAVAPGTFGLTVQAGGIDETVTVSTAASDVAVARAVIGLSRADAKAYAVVHDGAGLVDEAEIDLSGYDAPIITTIRWLNALVRTMETPLLAEAIAMASAIRVEPDGAPTIYVTDAEPMVVVLSQDWTKASLLALLAELVPASDMPQEADAPGRLVDLLPAEMAAGVQVGPSSPAEDGPELFTALNNTQAGSSSGRTVTFVDGGVFFIVTTAENNINFLIPGLTAGQVLAIRNAADSVGPINIRVTAAATLIVTNLAAGATHEYTVPAGFDGIVRVQTGGARLSPGCTVSCKVKDAIPAVPEQPIDLTSVFSGDVELSIGEWPPGLEPVGGVIPGTAAPSEGGYYTAELIATDARGVRAVATAQVTVTEDAAVSAPVIVAADGGAVVEGATLRIDATVAGFPPPTLEWEWGVDDTFGALTEFFTVPNGAAEVHGRVRIAGGSWVVATPVSVEASAPDAAPGPVDAGAWSLVDAQAAGGDALTLTILANVTATPGVSSWQYSLNGGAWTTFASGAAGADLTGAYTISGLATGVEASVVVRAVNAEDEGFPSAAKSATPTVTPAPGMGLTSDQWRVYSDVSDGATTAVTIDVEGAHKPLVRIDGGTPIELDYRCPGLFRVGGRPATTLQSYEVSIDGGTTWSAPKSAMATAASNTRVLVEADGEVARQLTTQPSATGANTVIAVPGAGDLEIVRFSGSRFQARYIGSGTPGTGDWILYNPLGYGRGLLPGETVATQVAGSAVGTLNIVMRGACGMTTYQRTPSVFGFDADGDPVPFRFDRPKSVGRLPDGRPFVVGTVGFVHNGGNAIEVSPDATKGYRVVSIGGAKCCVVARPGIIPPLDATALDLASVGYSTAYVRRAGAYDFAADGWNDSAAAAGGSSGVTVRANFESVGIYFANAATSRCKVRFRKQGSSTWNPAQDLDYDSRDCSAYPAAFMAAKHRGTIIYLEPGTTYEGEIKNGSTYRRFTFTTRSYKPTKASAALGVVDGNVTVSRSGNTVTVSRAGLADLTIDTTGVDFAEIHSGCVRRGTISVASGTTNVIIRDVDVHGGLRDGVFLGGGCSEIRVFGGRHSGWGSPHNDDESRWCAHQSNAIRPAALCSKITALGCFYGSPRYPANSWDERNSYWPEDTSSLKQHPWGASFIGADNVGMRDGQIVLDGVTGQVHRLRSLYDGIAAPMGKNNPAVSEVGGAGPDSVIQWCRSHGGIDESLEVEGSQANLVVAHNVIEATMQRAGNSGVRFAIGLADVAHGPAYVVRNLCLMDASATGGDTRGYGQVYKLKPEGAVTGRILGAHNTAVSLGSGYFRKGWSVISGPQVAPFDEINSLIQTELDLGNWGVTLTQVRHDVGALDAANALDADFRPTGSAVRAPGTAVRLANINDGGPFYRATPSLGALEAA